MITNPWLVPGRQDHSPGCMTIGGTDRISKIRTSTDLAWLRTVLSYPDNQLTVRQAAERRIRVLTRPIKYTAV